MNAQVTHVIVHNDQQVRAIINEAMCIADEQTDYPNDREMIFREACRLLGERWTFLAPATAVQLPLTLADMKRRAQ
jgi:hypothetical protein